MVKAEERTALADDLVVPKSDLDNLSNFFLDCVYAQRKSLRQKLLKIKMNDSMKGSLVENEFGSIMSQGGQSIMDGGSTGGRHNKLLETYMRIVKTGAPEEIEQFSKIERQKLVELLCTNQDLLNFMFDKMFVHVNEPQESSSRGFNNSNQFVL